MQNQSPVVVQSIWPSLRRAVASALTLFNWPLFLLATLSAAKIFGLLGWIELQGALRDIVGLQTDVFQRVSDYIAGAAGIAIPPLLIDALLIYGFIGGAIEKAEEDEILAVHISEEERRGLLREGIRSFRPEFLFYAVPIILRGWAVRLLWPLVALYRIGTPFVVEGPGPSGDEISTSVPRSEIDGFRAMLVENDAWEQQTVFDHRQVIAWQMSLAAIAAALASLVSGII